MLSLVPFPDGSGCDCEVDRTSLEQWATQVGWKQVGGDFAEQIMKHGRQLKGIRLEQISGTQINYRYHGIIKSTVRWVYGPKEQHWQDFILEFKQQLLASSLWRTLQINSKCVHDEEFLWQLLDVFASVKSRLVEIWRHKNGHDINFIEEETIKYLQKHKVDPKHIIFEKPKKTFMGDISYGGLAFRKKTYVSIKSVLWYPFSFGII
jgi:hypothetical protein